MVPKVTHVARPQLFLSPSPSPYSSDSSSDLDSDSYLDDAEDGQKAMMVKPVKLGESSPAPTSYNQNTKVKTKP
jgi:hypothetical protein